MSQRDTSSDSGGGGGGRQTDEGAGLASGWRPRQSLRSVADSGALAGVGGGVGLLRGLRALRRGNRARGLLGLVVGASLLAVAAAQRRAAVRRRVRRAEVEQTDVVDTSPDVEDVATGTENGGGEHATGARAREVADTSVDVEDAVGDEDDVAVEDAAGDEGPFEAPERLGEAAIDGESLEIPVPQRAFNREFLSLGDEAFWGVREQGRAVVVSGSYDPVEERAGTRYVASSEVDDERMLRVPDRVLDHWDEVAGGGTVVEGGEDLVFVTSDDLAANGLLLVVPAEWVDEVLGEGEGGG